MPRHRRTELTTLLPAILCFAVAAAGQTSSVRKVHVLNNKSAVEIEIEASDRLVPQTQVLTGPDRLRVAQGDGGQAAWSSISPTQLPVTPRAASWSIAAR